MPGRAAATACGGRLRGFCAAGGSIFICGGAAAGGGMPPTTPPTVPDSSSSASGAASAALTGCAACARDISCWRSSSDSLRGCGTGGGIGGGAGGGGGRSARHGVGMNRSCSPIFQVAISGRARALAGSAVESVISAFSQSSPVCCVASPLNETRTDF